MMMRVSPAMQFAMNSHRASLSDAPLCSQKSAAVSRSRPSLVVTRAGPSQKKKSIKDVGTPEAAFTRDREVIVGRLAMTGFFAEVIGELATGKGAVGQLSLETLLPRPVIGAGIAAIVLFNFVTALNPAGPTFSESNQRDVDKRPAGSNGFSTFGFTKANEVFVGRTAMIGFAASLIGEYFQGGKGPLGQIGIPMPAYADYAAFGLAGWILFFFAAAIGTGNFPGEREGGDDIYEN